MKRTDSRLRAAIHECLDRMSVDLYGYTRVGSRTSASHTEDATQTHGTH